MESKDDDENEEKAIKKRKIISILATPLFGCRNHNHVAKNTKMEFILTPEGGAKKSEHFCFVIVNDVFFHHFVSNKIVERKKT